MAAVRVPLALRAKLGDQASEALAEMMYEAGREWRDQLWERAVDRFERRITEEVTRARVEILRWSFLFWITQLSATAGLFAYIK
jgi:hypothetical protein